MDLVLEEYINKKREALSGQCSCGQECYIFVENLSIGRYTVCKKCGSKLFFLECDQCESGFSVPEKSESLANGEWKCEICDKIHTGLPEVRVENYSKNELPKEVLKKLKPSLNIFGVILISVVLYIITRLILVIKEIFN